ncbi:MAG: hypothetical protein ACI92S_004651, partial [Planctomycetaceae bacterium]
TAAESHRCRIPPLQNPTAAESRSPTQASISYPILQRALRIDDEAGNSVDGGFFEQRDTESGFSATCHADDHGVRREVFRVIQNLVGFQLTVVWIELFSQIEGSEFS